MFLSWQKTQAGSRHAQGKSQGLCTARAERSLIVLTSVGLVPARAPAKSMFLSWQKTQAGSRHAQGRSQGLCTARAEAQWS